jgi:two-component system phosphate regulon response regulator PhoB
MSNYKILVIEDEPEIREIIEYNLKREGYQLLEAESGEQGLRMAASQNPDLIILDIMLPGIDGLEICRQLKRDSHLHSIPLIMVTARTEETDVVTGLELGADDYITKPFSPRVLVARVRARLRARKTAVQSGDSPIRIKRITIDPGRHLVKVDNKSIHLTATEFNILNVLARHAGWVMSRYDIVNAVRGENAIVTDRSVDVQIAGLRKKLGACGNYIETVRGVGYRLSD